MNQERIASMVNVTDRFVSQFISSSHSRPQHTKDFWRNFKTTTAGVNAASLEVLAKRTNFRLFNQLQRFRSHKEPDDVHIADSALIHKHNLTVRAKNKLTLVQPKRV